MKDSFAFGLDMVSDLARNPKFAPEEIERQRQQILSGLKVGYEDPDYIAGMVFDRLVYGFHPYGRPDSGTPTVDREHHARRPRRLPQGLVRRQQRHPRHRRRHHPRGGVCRRRARVRQLGARRGDVPPSRWIRRRRPGASSSSIGQVRSRPRSASATSACRAGTRTTWRSTWRSTFSAAKAATGCTACCARIAG